MNLQPQSANVIQCGPWHPWELLGREYQPVKQINGLWKYVEIKTNDPLYKFQVYDSLAYLEERFGLKAQY